MTKQFLVVAYDIPDDRRRQRLHHVLEGFGTPVQYSVFECLLEDKEVARLKQAVKRSTSLRKDHIRYYYLCAACQKRIEATAGKEVTHAEHTVIV